MAAIQHKIIEIKNFEELKKFTTKVISNCKNTEQLTVMMGRLQELSEEFSAAVHDNKQSTIKLDATHFLAMYGKLIIEGPI